MRDWILRLMLWSKSRMLMMIILILQESRDLNMSKRPKISKITLSTIKERQQTFLELKRRRKMTLVELTISWGQAHHQLQLLVDQAQALILFLILELMNQSSWEVEVEVTS